MQRKPHSETNPKYLNTQALPFVCTAALRSACIDLNQNKNTNHAKHLALRIRS